jgi:hypothetical protein
MALPRSLLSSMVGLALGAIAGIGRPLSSITDMPIRAEGFGGLIRPNRGTRKQGKRNAHRAARLANKRARKARVCNAQRRRGVR